MNAVKVRKVTNIFDHNLTLFCYQWGRGSQGTNVSLVEAPVLKNYMMNIFPFLYIYVTPFCTNQKSTTWAKFLPVLSNL